MFLFEFDFLLLKLLIFSNSSDLSINGFTDNLGNFVSCRFLVRRIVELSNSLSFKINITSYLWKLFLPKKSKRENKKISFQK